MKKNKKVHSTTAIAYVGAYDGGQLGWGMPTFLSHIDGCRTPDSINTTFNPHFRGKAFYKCLVTITPILRNGKPVTRKMK